MRDLVETVISQVMRQENPYPATTSASARMPNEPARTVHRLTPASQAHGSTPPANDRLWQASRQFEALFVEQMLASMRKTVPESDFLGKGFADDVQSSMLDQAIAEAVSKQGRMGIATSLYRQLSNEHATQAAAQISDKPVNHRSTESHGNEQGELHGTH